MKRWIAALLLGVSTLAAANAPGNGKAAVEPDTTYMVEIAVFTCPHCRAVDGFTAKIESELGKQFVFSPLATGGNDAAERAWFALREGRNPERVRAALYALHQDMRLSSPNEAEVTDWLNLHSGVNQDALAASMKGKKPIESVEKVRRLVGISGVLTVPAFVFIRNGKVLGTLEKGSLDPKDFVDEGMRRYRQFNGDVK